MCGEPKEHRVHFTEEVGNSPRSDHRLEMDFISDDRYVYFQLRHIDSNLRLTYRSYVNEPFKDMKLNVIEWLQEVGIANDEAIRVFNEMDVHHG